MKSNIFASCLIAIFITVGAFAQDGKKPEPKKKHEKTMWDKKVMVGGKDTRFSGRQKRGNRIKPGSEQK